MKKSTLFLLLFLGSFLFSCSTTPPKPQKKKKNTTKLTEEMKQKSQKQLNKKIQKDKLSAAKNKPIHFIILHTNDFHGQLLSLVRKHKNKTIKIGGASHIAAYVNSVKKKARAEGAEVILLDAGDVYQGTPEGNFTRGKLVMEYMNYLGYDAMELGNHEFDFGEKIIEEMAKTADFPFLSANLYVNKDFSRPSYCRPYLMIERKGIRIAVVGLITPELHKVAALKWVKHLQVLHPIPIGLRMVELMKEKKAQVTIFLSHIGFQADKDLAEMVDGIDFIIGGHSHTRVSKLTVVNNTLIGQAGSRGMYVGRTEFWIDGKTKKILRKAYRLVPVGPAMGRDLEVEKLIAKYKPAIDKVMNRKIGFCDKELKRNWGDTSSSLGNLMADSIKEFTRADLAFQNKGGIRANLPYGVIRYREIYQIAPFGNKIVTILLTGKQIKRLFVKGIQRRSLLEVAGAKCYFFYDKKRDKTTIFKIMVGKEILREKKLYKVATSSFLADGGGGFLTFQKGIKRVNLGVPCRRALVQWIQKRSPLNYLFEQRYIIPKAEKKVPSKKGR